MFLEKLEIFGFKAIPYKLKIQFGPGVTGIIGPNGCGKSNLSDAIRWVLGEQSVRQLRGHSMEDVIFNGTAARKPLGIAEVYLTFSKNSADVPLDYDTITVGRRLFRSGQSEYLLNKSVCRLRDVRDLLLDTGIGSSGYSLIAREMVESVLADDSGQRRQMMEEAAGISKYKARKREALLKLRGTEEDLVRVADIVSEVERELRSLGRQVGRARRYRRYHERIRHLDLAVSRVRVYDLAARRDQLTADLVGLRADLEGRRARTSELELTVEQQRLGEVEIERELAVAQGAVERLDRQLAEWDSEAKVLGERRSAVGRRVEEARAEIERATDRLEASVHELAQATADRDGLLRTEATELETLAEREAALRAAERDWRARRTELAERKQLRLGLVEDHVERRAAFEQSRRRREELGGRLDARLADQDEAAGELESRDTQLTRVRDELETIREQSAATHEALHAAEEQVIDLEGRAQDLAERSTAYVERAAAHESRLEVLFDLKRRYEGYARGVQTLLRDGRPGGLHGTVSEVLRVPGELIEAMESALGAAAGYIVADARGGAGAHFDRLRDAQGGRATFLPLDALDGDRTARAVSASNGDGALDGLVGRAHLLVEPAAERYRPVVDFLLGDVVVVDDRTSALAALDRPELAGLRIVTRDGELWSHGGAVAGGSTGSTAATSPLGREQEIAAVETALADVRAELETLGDTRRGVAAELAAAIEGRDLLRRRSADERETTFELEKSAQAAELALHAQTESMDALEHQIAELRSEIAALDTQASDLGQALDSARSRSDDFEAGYAELETEVARLEETRDLCQRQEQESRLRWTENAGRLSEVRGMIERLGAELVTLRTEIERRHREIVSGEQEDETLAARVVALEAQVAGGHLERETLAGELGQVEERYAGARAATSEIEKQLRETRRGLDGLVEQVHRAELDLERARGEIEATGARVREEYEVELLETREELDEGQSPDAAAQELASLRERLRSIGPVNLLAVEQHDEVQERYEFLTRQRDDLTQAREELLEAIEHINHTAAELFHQTFEKVQENFREVFTTLFQGGEAELRLDGDELDGAIQIMARPRGKNLRSVSLMSGGERALTAISLLFALYLAKPSPFCIMDEVDAPLDDANVDRFVNLLRRFSRDTQFIVITHNKKTMEASERLYGVTMEEPGVSRLVSVRLEHGEIQEVGGDTAREAEATASDEASGVPTASPLIPGSPPADDREAADEGLRAVGLDPETLEAELDAEALAGVGAASTAGVRAEPLPARASRDQGEGEATAS